MVSYVTSKGRRVAWNASLNPYCSGRWSRTSFSNSFKRNSCSVLILIVVEDGLVLQLLLSSSKYVVSLNPYCSGRWSRTWSDKKLTQQEGGVLILIVVEDGLVPLELQGVKPEVQS